MATLSRIPVTWDGLSGLPGVSIFYGTAAPGSLIGDLKTFFTAIAGLVPLGLTWTVPVAGDTIDEGTGQLVGSWSQTGGGSVVSTAVSGGYAAGTGARVKWITGNIVAGRKVRGATFICPLTAVCYENNGTINTTPLGTLQSAANALAGSVNFRIWSRPVPGRAGVSSFPTGAVVPDRVTSLRSRRF